MRGGVIEKDYILNNRIRFNKLRVLDSDGSNLGIIDTSEALSIAQSKELDLVVVTAGANPPVAKILDYNKFLYAERKKSAEIKGRSKQGELKELRVGPNTSIGDLESRAKRVKEFIEEGHQVKVSAVMRGRQAMFPAVALEKLQNLVSRVSEFAKADTEPKRNGNAFFVILSKK
jgi:translation initiation factor IF-3